MGPVVDRIQIRINRTGCDLVETWLPYVHRVGIDKSHLCSLFAAQAFAEPGSQWQSTGATTNNQNTWFYRYSMVCHWLAGDELCVMHGKNVCR